MRREQHERVALVLAANTEDPFALVAQVMAAFDASLEADPAESVEDAFEEHTRQLMEQEA